MFEYTPKDSSLRSRGPFVNFLLYKNLAVPGLVGDVERFIFRIEILRLPRDVDSILEKTCNLAEKELGLDYLITQKRTIGTFEGVNVYNLLPKYAIANGSENSPQTKELARRTRDPAMVFINDLDANVIYDGSEMSASQMHVPNRKSVQGYMLRFYDIAKARPAASFALGLIDVFKCSPSPELKGILTSMYNFEN